MGTYIVDLVAMTFAFPVALFPEMAEKWGGAKAAGILFSSMAIGSFLVTVLSGFYVGFFLDFFWRFTLSNRGGCVRICTA